MNFEQVWAVLKPGFLALLGDPFDTNLLDIIVFDMLPTSDGDGEGRILLAEEIKDHNPLRYAFKVEEQGTSYLDADLSFNLFILVCIGKLYCIS